MSQDKETTDEKLSLILEALLEKKALEPVLLDIRNLATFADYFIICHGDSSRQVQALCDNVIEKVKSRGFSIEHLEGYETSNWILIDCADIIVHVFVEEKRLFYQLEKLWNDAVRVEVPSS